MKCTSTYEWNGSAGGSKAPLTSCFTTSFFVSLLCHEALSLCVGCRDCKRDCLFWNSLLLLSFLPHPVHVSPRQFTSLFVAFLLSFMFFPRFLLSLTNHSRKRTFLSCLRTPLGIVPPVHLRLLHIDDTQAHQKAGRACLQMARNTDTGALRAMDQIQALRTSASPSSSSLATQQVSGTFEYPIERNHCIAGTRHTQANVLLEGTIPACFTHMLFVLLHS